MYKITPLPKNINNFECIILFEELKFIIRRTRVLRMIEYSYVAKNSLIFRDESGLSPLKPDLLIS